MRWFLALLCISPSLLCTAFVHCELALLFARRGGGGGPTHTFLNPYYSKNNVLLHPLEAEVDSKHRCGQESGRPATNTGI